MHTLNAKGKTMEIVKITEAVRASEEGGRNE